MRSRLILFLLCCVLTLGCTNQSSDVAENAASDATTPAPMEGAGGGAGRIPGGPHSPGLLVEPAVDPVAVPIEAGAVTLSPENTQVQFVGTHVGEPKPRTGVFTKFTGEAKVDAEAKVLQSLSAEIQIESLTTAFAALTTHLKSPDFFDAREHPTAKFESTNIAGEAAEQTVTGNFTLLGVTKEITFPAKVTIEDSGLLMTAELTIDRTEWGMEGSQDRVNKEVALTIAVGQRTQPPQSDGGRGAGGGGRRGGGGFDPAAFFKQRDADGDGKLSGDEISDRMKENLAETDTDGDGAISLEEFQSRMRSRSGGRGGRGGPGGGGAGAGDQPDRPDSE